MMKGREQDGACGSAARLEAAIYLALIISATIPYLGTVRHGYFLMDDFGALFLSRDFEFSRLFDPSFYYTYGTYGFFRPFGLILWRVDYLLYGFNPAGYFITNLLLHIACTVLVYFITAFLAGDKKAGLLAGLIFAVHPSHAEALSWLSCRYDLASTMFYLGGFLLYIKHGRGLGRDWKTYCLILALELLALMSKEMAVTFPLALVLYELFYVKGGHRELVRALIRTLPFFAVAVLFVLLRAAIFHGMGGYGEHASIAGVQEVATRLEYYLLTLLFGFNLDYPYHVLAVSMALLAALTVALACLVYSSRERKRLALFLAALVFLTFLPLLNFSRITEKFFINSRYMYLPSAGYSAFLGMLLVQAGQAGKVLKKLAPLAAAVIIVCYYATAVNNSAVWIDKSRLSSSILSQFKGFYPGSVNRFDITVLNFPENIFGRNYYIPKNLSRALVFAYGGVEQHFMIESGQNLPGNPVTYSRTPREGYIRKAVVAYDYNTKTIFPVYDSRDVKGQ